MVKPAKKAKPKHRLENLLSTLPWSCTSFGEESEIEVHLESEGGWKTIADVHPVSGFDGEELASFMLRAVNGYQATQSVLLQATTVLHRCQSVTSLSSEMKTEIEQILKLLIDRTDNENESET